MKYLYLQDSLRSTPDLTTTPDTLVKETSTIPGSTNVGSSIRKQIETRITPLNSVQPAANADSLFQLAEKRRIATRKIVPKPEKKAEVIKKPVQVTLPKELAVSDSITFHANPFLNHGSNALIRFPRIFSKTTEKNYSELNAQVTKKETSAYPSDFFLGIILLISVIIVFTKLIFKKYFSNYFLMAFNYQLASNLLRDKNAFFTRFNSMLNSIYVINISVFIYQGIYYFKIIPELQLKFFLYIIIFITLLALARIIILKILGEVYAVQKTFTEYLFNQFMFNKILGLVLLPVVFIIPYVNENLRNFLIYFGIFLIASAFLIKLLRGFTIIIKKEVLLFYVLLYLCTLEILPILIGVSYFKRLV